MSSIPDEKTGWSSLFSAKANLALGLVSAILIILYGLVFILKPENLYVDDSYFYLQVAWNIARGMGSTFNNVMPTNGYHPLFMLVCVAVFQIFPERLVAIHAVAAVIVLFDASMLLTVRRILLRTGGDLWPVALVLLVPFSFLTQLGTEGALSGCLLALMMLFAYELVQAPDGRKAAFYNLVAALAVLTLAMRVGMHHVLLHEALEVTIGAPRVCANCSHLVPAMGFCPQCGVAERAVARPHRRPASWPLIHEVTPASGDVT